MEKKQTLSWNDKFARNFASNTKIDAKLFKKSASLALSELHNWAYGWYKPIYIPIRENYSENFFKSKEPTNNIRS